MHMNERNKAVTVKLQGAQTRKKERAVLLENSFKT